MYSYGYYDRLANVELAGDDNCMITHFYDKMILSSNHTHDVGIK